MKRLLSMILVLTLLAGLLQLLQGYRIPDHPC